MTKTFNELFPHKEGPLLPSPSIWTRMMRVIYDTGRGFIEDDCYSKASALTYYSIFSVVPILAILFGIAKGFGLEQALEFEMGERFSEQRELMDKMIQFAYSWLQTVKGDIIAGVGIFALFWSVLGLLNSIESSLNAIWKMPISRSFGRRMSDYLAAIVVCPFFLIVSSSITVWISNLTHISENLFVEVINPLLLFILKLFPFLLSWSLFTFVYYFLPNTKVYIRSAGLAGIIAGTVFQIWQWIYIKFQIGAASYGAIYGSFAALPLFLIWIQVSWFILLGGAEMAFEIENDLFIPYRRLISLSSKAAALLVTYRCVESFVLGQKPQTDQSLAHELGISMNHLHTILETLQEENIIAAISYKDKTIGYQPARAANSITFSLVCNAIDKSNELRASVRDSTPFQIIQDYLKESSAYLDEARFNHPIFSIDEK